MGVLNPRNQDLPHYLGVVTTDQWHDSEELHFPIAHYIQVRPRLRDEFESSRVYQKVSPLSPWTIAGSNPFRVF